MSLITEVENVTRVRAEGRLNEDDDGGGGDGGGDGGDDGGDDGAESRRLVIRVHFIYLVLHQSLVSPVLFVFRLSIYLLSVYFLMFACYSTI